MPYYRSDERKEAYDLIDQERDYQNQHVIDSVSKDQNTPVAEWVIHIMRHTNYAMEAIGTGDKEDAMAQVRKIAALAVAAMEYNPTPERDL